jgi:hypothetical protein
MCGPEAIIATIACTLCCLLTGGCCLLKRQPAASQSNPQEQEQEPSCCLFPFGQDQQQFQQHQAMPPHYPYQEMDPELEEETRAQRLEAYIFRKRAEAAESYLRGQQQGHTGFVPAQQVPTPVNPHPPAPGTPINPLFPPGAFVFNPAVYPMPSQAQHGIGVYSYYP